MEEFVKSLAEVMERPPQTLAKLTGYNLTIASDQYVVENDSEEDPPKWFSEKSDIIEIDECLGLYDPDEMKITIFVKGIEIAGQIIGCNAKHLEHIVRLHEYAHAIVHVRVTLEESQRAAKESIYATRFLEQAITTYKSIESRVHEQLAQLLTYHSLKILRDGAKHKRAKAAIDQRIEVFERLNQYQPAEYRLRGEDLQVSRDRIVTVLDLLKGRHLSCDFNAWNTILHW